MHAVAAKAVALRECLQPAYQAYARQVVANAQALAEGARGRGHAAGLRRHRHPPRAARPAAASASPGTEAEARCDAAGITLNKNAIPYDPQPPMVASGIRVGTPGGHHPGHDRGRHEGGRRADRPRGARRRRHRGRRGRRRRWPRSSPRTRRTPPGLSAADAACASTCSPCCVAAAVTYLLTPVGAAASRCGGARWPGPRPRRARDPDPAARRRRDARRASRGAAGGAPSCRPCAAVFDDSADRRRCSSPAAV